MKLRNKLFFAASLLLTLLGALFLLSFFLLLKTNLSSTRDKISKIIESQRDQEKKRELSFFKEIVDEEKERLNALFLALKPEKDVWTFLASTLATHPDIGFAQWDQNSSSEIFTIVPKIAHFYSVSTFAMNDRFFFVVIDKGNQTVEEDNLFLAYPITASVYGAFPVYLLFSWQEVGKEMENFLGALIAKSPISLPHKNLSTENEQEKLGLINALAPFYEKGVDIFPGKNKMVPQGIAFLSSEGKGKALLSSELFLKTSFFDDKAYYEKHRPTSSFLSVADGEALITRIPNEIYVGNVSMYGDALLTLGFPITPLLKTFAKTTHQNVLLVSGKSKIGFHSSGERMKKEDEQFILDHPSFHLTLLPVNELTLYLAPSREDDKSFFDAMNLLSIALVKKFFLHLTLLILGLLIIALLILNYLSYQFTKPIARLVSIAEQIKDGKLKDIVFSTATKSEDELFHLTQAFKSMVIDLQEKEKIRSLLNKVVSKEIAEEILKSDVHLGGEDRVITILFADIRNFTELSQNLPPQKTVGILNDVMTIVSRIIESEGGVIDKYVGDEVMALFGAPISHPDHALRALSAAKLIIETLRKWNKDRESKGETAVEIGIGINTGLVVAGNMGAEDRLNYTVVGPSVNLASRLCKAALPMQVIISEFTLEEPAIKDSFYVESLAPVILKGFYEPVKVFQVTGFKWESV